MSNFSYLCFSRFLWGELQYGKIIRDEMLELFIYDFDFWIFLFWNHGPIKEESVRHANRIEKTNLKKNSKKSSSKSEYRPVSL